MLPQRLVGGPVVTRSHRFVFCKRFAAAVALSLSIVPANAGDWSFKVSIRRPIRASSICVSGSGRATPRRTCSIPRLRLVSRLTYSHFAIFTGEGVARSTSTTAGSQRLSRRRRLVVRQAQGRGFPPAIVPYSATLSTQKSGSLTMAASMRGQFRARTGFSCRTLCRLPLPARDGERLRLRTDRDQSGRLRRRHSRFREGDHPGQQLELGARRHRCGFEINRFKLAVDAAWLPYVFCRFGCALAADRSAGRRLQRSDPRGRHRLGLSARRRPVLSRERLRSASGSAAATGTWKRPA